MDHYSHTSVSLTVPAISWLAFLSVALFQPPGSSIFLPILAMLFGFFLVAPYHVFHASFNRFIGIHSSWRTFRYLRITNASSSHFQRPQDWRFIGIARKSE